MGNSSARSKTHGLSACIGPLPHVGGYSTSAATARRRLQRRLALMGHRGGISISDRRLSPRGVIREGQLGPRFDRILLLNPPKPAATLGARFLHPSPRDFMSGGTRAGFDSPVRRNGGALTGRIPLRSLASSARERGDCDFEMRIGSTGTRTPRLPPETRFEPSDLQPDRHA